MRPQNKNLRPIKKGEVRNPYGRPKLPDIRAELDKVLSMEVDGKVALYGILLKQVDNALKGDVNAAKFLIERGYGKVSDKIELTDKTDRPPVIQVVDDATLKNLQLLRERRQPIEDD